jgi:hypothetical protein
MFDLLINNKDHYLVLFIIKLKSNNYDDNRLLHDHFPYLPWYHPKTSILALVSSLDFHIGPGIIP